MPGEERLTRHQLVDSLNDASKAVATIASIISGIAFLISLYFLWRK